MGIGFCNLREMQIGDDGRQVKGQPCGADGMERPDQREQPDLFVSQSLHNLAEVEVHLRGKRRVWRSSGLHEGLFFAA
jgi:hypothetical protein